MTKMKTITCIVFIISFSIFSFAQPNRDKIKTLKIAFITEKLDLSEKEAQQFWPVYNAFEEEHFKLRRQSYNGKKNINFETIKEEEAVAVLKEMRSLETKRIITPDTSRRAHRINEKSSFSFEEKGKTINLPSLNLAIERGINQDLLGSTYDWGLLLYSVNTSNLESGLLYTSNYFCLPRIFNSTTNTLLPSPEAFNQLASPNVGLQNLVVGMLHQFFVVTVADNSLLATYGVFAAVYLSIIYFFKSKYVIIF